MTLSVLKPALDSKQSQCESEEKDRVSVFAVALTLTLPFVAPAGIEPARHLVQNQIFTIRQLVGTRIGHSINQIVLKAVKKNEFLPVKIADLALNRSIFGKKNQTL